MQKKEGLDFANDVSTVGNMETKTTRLYDIAMTAGPDINVTKARSMRINERRPPSLLMAWPVLICTSTFESQRRHFLSHIVIAIKTEFI